MAGRDGKGGRFVSNVGGRGGGGGRKEEWGWSKKCNFTHYHKKRCQIWCTVSTRETTGVNKFLWSERVRPMPGWGVHVLLSSHLSLSLFSSENNKVSVLQPTHHTDITLCYTPLDLRNLRMLRVNHVLVECA